MKKPDVSEKHSNNRPSTAAVTAREQPQGQACQCPIKTCFSDHGGRLSSNDQLLNLLPTFTAAFPRFPQHLLPHAAVPGGACVLLGIT